MEVSRAIVDELAQYIEAAIPSIGEVIRHFPDPNTALRIPSISIHGFAPEFAPELSPWPYNKAALDATTEEQISNAVKWVTGEWQLRLQVDIWAGSHAERHSIFEQFFQALAAQFPVMGLSLGLSEYHNVIARYDFVGADFTDTEEQIQRREYRTRVDLLAHCAAITERYEDLIKSGSIEFDTYRGDEEEKDVQFEWGE